MDMTMVSWEEEEEEDGWTREARQRTTSRAA